MAKKQVFQQAFEAGMAFLNLTRDRAEEVVKDLVKAGEVSKGKAQKAIDDLLERSRQGTEELRGLIRREVSELGLATREDVARIEARLDAVASAPPDAAAAAAASEAPPAGPAPAAKAPAEPPASKPATKKAPAATKAPAKKAAAKKGAAKKAVAKKKAAAKGATATDGPGAGAPAPPGGSRDSGRR